ncbi:MAG: hypothetical protein Q8O09_02090 [Bacillota bacterium]|nr:hypothetical protein [Bacillota bacterium]
MPNASQSQIESKNLTILEDQMKHEALACKKSGVYANYFTDPTLKSLAQDISLQHRQNFDGLFQYLSSHQ